MGTKKRKMSLILTIFLAGGLAWTQQPAADTKPEADAPAHARDGAQPNLLALPPGKVTVMGGTVDRVDLINDQFTLRVFGAKPVKILFDERTRVYRDGKKTTVAGLRANERASVETMLDGTTVFARSIHMLSTSPQGECQGQVVSFDAGTRELTVSEVLSREPIKLMVPAGTAFVRQGQAESGSGTASASDLMKGTLVSATFTADNKGQGVASKIAILAMPGSQITFAGNVTYLNLRTKELALLDAQDQQSYKIFFDPALFPDARDLRVGSRVKVTAEFDGAHYVAKALAIR
jgi:hypothetical protein